MDDITIAFDESGNTGQDLLNPSQLLFVLSSVKISEDDAKRLLSHFDKSSAAEKHFVRLKKRKAGQEQILNFLNDKFISPENVKACIHHKKFMAFCKMVDFLVEPQLREIGINIYMNSLNIALSNLHFTCMPQSCGVKESDLLVELFVRMVRIKDQNSTIAFFEHLGKMKSNCRDSRYPDFLALMLSAMSRIPDILVTNDRSDLDPAIPAYMSLVNLWNKQLPEWFITIHDESKILASYKEYILAMMNPSIETTEVGFGTRKWEYPFKVKDFVLANSQLYASLQVADLIASSVSYLYRKDLELEVEGEFWGPLSETRLRDCVVWSVLPSDKVTPAELGAETSDGIDPIEFTAEIIRRAGL